MIPLLTDAFSIISKLLLHFRMIYLIFVLKFLRIINKYLFLNFKLCIIRLEGEKYKRLLNVYCYFLISIRVKELLSGKRYYICNVMNYSRTRNIMLIKCFCKAKHQRF